MRIIALLLLLAPGPGFAQARGGISGTGGGNSINHRLVEEYAVSPEGEAAALFEEKMKMLEKELPVFGRELRESYEKLTFYSIPRKLKELPTEQTGLDFANEQMAIHRDDEVFADGEILDKMGPRGKAMFFMHEALMSMMKEKKSRDVRRAVTKIFETNVKPDALQRALVHANFGANLTARQFEELRAHGKKSYLSASAQALDRADKACATSANEEEILKELQSSCPAYPLGAAPNGCSKFNSPFRVYPDVYQLRIRAFYDGWDDRIFGNGVDLLRMDLNYSSRRQGTSDIHIDVLHELGNMHGQFGDRRARLDADNKARTPLPEEALRLRIAEQNASHGHAEAKSERGKLYAKFAALPAYRNILALDASISGVLETENFRESLGHSPMEKKTTDKLVRELRSRVSEVKAMPAPERRRLLCNSVSAMKKEVVKLAGPRPEQPGYYPGLYEEQEDEPAAEARDAR